MKRTIISWIVGVIFGFIGCIAAVVGLLHKILKVERVRSEIAYSVKNIVTVLLFGEKRVTYVPYRYGTYNMYDKYSASSYYISDVIRRIEMVKFDTYKEAQEALGDIERLLKSKGRITVEEVLGIISKDSDCKGKYTDAVFGWTSPDSFNVVAMGLSETSKYRIYVLLDPFKLDTNYRKEEKYV